MKMWLVKFYELEIPRDISFKNGFFHITPIRSKEIEKEIHSYMVDSEEKADFLVEAFTSTTTSAKKIELEG